MANPIRYTRNFAIGTSTHIVEVYDSYSDADGLGELVERREHTRISECLAGLKIPKPQRDLLRRLMADKNDGIAFADGSYKAN